MAYFCCIKYFVAHFSKTFYWLVVPRFLLEDLFSTDQRFLNSHPSVFVILFLQFLELTYIVKNEAHQSSTINLEINNDTKLKENIESTGTGIAYINQAKNFENLLANEKD